MQNVLSYRHRAITDEDLIFIRKLIAEHPHASRWALSKKLCEAWNWVQANGALRNIALVAYISFGTRSLVGSNSLALLASVIDTCRARNASVTDLLARAIHAARLGLPAPALPPIPTHLLGRNGALVGM